MASSNELKADRDQFAAFITRLNEHYEPRGFEFILKIWEFLDPAYNNERKQEEYNAVIRKCDYFVSLFHTKAGKYTLEELKVAREECVTRHMPLFIYFRDLDYWQALQQKDKNLEEVKQYLGDGLEHFWGGYNNNDKLHLDFVLWLDKKLNQNSTIKVEGDDVKIGDLPLMSFAQLPFVLNNAEYQRLEQQLTALEKDIEKLRQNIKKYPDDEDFSEQLSQKVLAREALQQEYQRQQDALLGAAKRIAEMRKQQVSEKLAKAAELFENGQLEVANTYLDELEHEGDQLYGEIQSRREELKIKNDQLHDHIEGLRLQTQTVMAKTGIPISKRITQVAAIYAKADKWAAASNYDEEKYAKLLNDYAQFLYNYAHYPEAVEVYLRQIPLSEKLYGTDHSDTATSYNNIGLVFDSQGAYSQALEYYNKALEIYKKVLGEDHPYTATSYNNIGAVYKAQGAYSQALEYYNKALEIREKVLGKDHPDTATSYNNIGAVYDAQGVYAQALDYYKKALAIKKKVLDENHPSIATSYNNIGLVYKTQGTYAQALDYFNKALGIWKKLLGEHHPNTATTYNNIGWVYRAQGDYKQALVYYDKAFAICQEKLGDDHPKTKDVKLSIKIVKGKLAGSDGRSWWRRLLAGLFGK